MYSTFSSIIEYICALQKQQSALYHIRKKRWLSRRNPFKISFGIKSKSVTFKIELSIATVLLNIFDTKVSSIGQTWPPEYKQRVISMVSVEIHLIMNLKIYTLLYLFQLLIASTVTRPIGLLAQLVFMLLSGSIGEAGIYWTLMNKDSM